MQTINFTLQGEEITLSADRALYWPTQNILLIADTHFGKDGSFRAAGISLPSGTLDYDLSRLTHLIETFAPDRLLVLGDMFHHRSGINDALLSSLSAWKSQHQQLSFELVLGNHDRITPSIFVEIGCTNHGENLHLAPFTLCHQHQPDSDAFQICGHVHPVVQIRETPKSRLRLPCFVEYSSHFLLPAFSSFAGGYAVSPRTARSLIPILEDSIFRYSGLAKNGSAQRD